MQTVRVKANVPESRQVVIDLPNDTPTGPAELEIRIARPDEVTAIPPPVIDVNSLPKYFDPESGEWQRVGRSGIVREVRNSK